MGHGNAPLEALRVRWLKSASSSIPLLFMALVPLPQIATCRNYSSRRSGEAYVLEFGYYPVQLNRPNANLRAISHGQGQDD